MSARIAAALAAKVHLKRRILRSHWLWRLSVWLDTIVQPRVIHRSRRRSSMRASKESDVSGSLLSKHLVSSRQTYLRNILSCSLTGLA